MPRKLNWLNRESLAEPEWASICLCQVNWGWVSRLARSLTGWPQDVECVCLFERTGYEDRLVTAGNSTCWLVAQLSNYHQNERKTSCFLTVPNHFISKFLEHGERAQTSDARVCMSVWSSLNTQSDTVILRQCHQDSENQIEISSKLWLVFTKYFTTICFV